MKYSNYINTPCFNIIIIANLNFIWFVSLGLHVGRENLEFVVPIRRKLTPRIFPFLTIILSNLYYFLLVYILYTCPLYVFLNIKFCWMCISLFSYSSFPALHLHAIFFHFHTFYYHHLLWHVFLLFPIMWQYVSCETTHRLTSSKKCFRM